MGPNGGLPREVKEKILEAAKELSFEGAFACSNTHTIDEAPNPGLSLSGLGTIGLPLSSRDAHSLIAMLEQDRDIRHTPPMKNFELPSNRVSFLNPAWQDWVQTTLISKVCAALGIHDVAEQRCRLEKLSLLMEGSCQAIESLRPSKDVYGSITVILPSPFTGGVMQASKLDQHETFDPAESSSLSTSVFAVYASVDCKLEPITSGYRLALHYSLQSIREDETFPQLPRPLEVAPELRETLRTWMQSETEEGSTAVLAYLLQGKIQRPAKAGAQVYSGSDAEFLQCLNHIVLDLSFDVCLADTTLGVYGSITWPSTPDQSYPDCSQIKVADLERDEKATREVVARSFVDVKGIPVEISGLALEEKDILNPESWGVAKIEAVSKQKNYMSQQNSWSIRYKYHYDRTLLLFWRKGSGPSIGIGDVYDYTYNSLRLSTSVVASPDESQLFDLLLQYCRKNYDDAVKQEHDIDRAEIIREKLVTAMLVLCDTAVRWENADLFTTTVELCPEKRQIELVGIETFIVALNTFGWAKGKDIMALAIAEDGDDNRRRELIDQIAEFGERNDSGEIKQWCKEQYEFVIKNVSLNHVDWLLSLVKERGAEFFEETLLHKLLQQNPIPDFWLSFVRQFHEEKGSIPSSSPVLVDMIISQCVQRAAETCMPFGIRNVETCKTVTESNEKLLLSFVDLCVSTNNIESCNKYFQLIESTQSSGIYSVDEIYNCYKDQLYELDSYLETRPDLDPFAHVFRVFFENVAAFFLREVPGKCMGDRDESKIVTRAGGLQRVLEKCGELEIIKPSLKSRSKMFLSQVLHKVSDFSKETALDLIDDGFKNDCAMAYINSIDLAELASNKVYGAFKLELMGAMKLCNEIGSQKALGLLATQLCSLLDKADSERHFSGLLSLLILITRDEAQLRSIACYTELGCAMAKYVARALSNKVRRPNNNGRGAFGCRSCCSNCKNLKQFLLSTETSVTYMWSFSGMKHVIDQFWKTKPTRWGVNWTIQSSDPDPIFQLSKPPYANLTSYDNIGLDLLGLLGDSDDQKQLLGDEYDWIFAAIIGKRALPADTAPASSTPGSASASSGRQKRAPATQASASGSESKKRKVD